MFHSSSLLPSLVHFVSITQSSSTNTPRVNFTETSNTSGRVIVDEPNRTNGKSLSRSLPCIGSSCFCGRRRFMEAATATAFFPICPASASQSDSLSDYAIAGYKSQLFANLKGKGGKVLEIGIGTGPNMGYYAGNNGVEVIGIDPNRKMEKYAKAAAMDAGLPFPNFKFIQAVGEAIPLDDASVDAIVGTLVLCSVKDVNLTLKEAKRVLRPGGLYLFVEHVAAKDGTSLRFIQSVLDPLQQTVADGCHLTRETGKNIFEAGFSYVQLNMAFLSNASLIIPHVYGIASK
ncbi:uncharacterized protein LOC107428942 isoform X2 [Ziziphus jujuba]|uniref:Uncharacterized protein LOC107428942 isoform X2 n=1 Tax=Ziziphus jujuba TaxID=326968 RepID=A0A6P6GHU3_ZIZJJ|nr:uncharacterized protein LOC107428942 isoform X2 [Ziziphus jujuba]